MADLRKAQAEVAKVNVTDETIDALIEIRDACKAEGIIASDRRWKKALKLVQAVAYMAGEKKTSPEDLAILVDSLWREPKDRPKVARLVGKLADPVGAQAAEILDAARETAHKVAALKAGDRKAYIAQAAQALEQFQAQQKKLGQLAKGAGRRAIRRHPGRQRRDHRAARRPGPDGQRRPGPPERPMKRVIYDVPRWHVYLHRDARGLEDATDRDNPVTEVRGRGLRQALLRRARRRSPTGSRTRSSRPGPRASTRPARSCPPSGASSPSARASPWRPAPPSRR